MEIYLSYGLIVPAVTWCIPRMSSFILPPMNPMANSNTTRTKEYDKSICIVSRTNTNKAILENMIIEPYIIERLQGITFHHNRSLKDLSSKCSVANNSQMLSGQTYF
jgi:hypothetical protein